MNLNKEELLQLKELIAKEEFHSNLIKEKRVQFEEQNSGLFEAQAEVSQEVSILREQIKEHALADYQEMKEKKMLGGIGIRVMKSLVYKAEDAMEWAKKNMPVCVKEVLDKKTFDTFAKTTSLDIVEIKETECVTFPKEILVE